MGNEQPKKLNKVTKAQIDMGSLKAKIHLQLMRDRKNGEVIKAEKQLVAKIKAKNRNKTQEILVAQRVINGLKYAQACNQLMAYAVSIRSQANFLAENINNPEKLAPWLTQIYTLIYAADMLGLSSLKQFKDLMRALNDPLAVNKYINPEIIQLLKPSPSPQEINIYMLQFSQRNNIQLDEINLAGHKFSKDFGVKDDSFADLEKKLAEELGQKMNMGDGGHNGGNGNMGGNGGQGWGGFGGNNGGNMGWGGQGGQGGFQGGMGPGGFVPGSKPPNYYDIDKNNQPQQKSPGQFSNPYGIRQSFDPRSNQNQLTNPNSLSNPSNKPPQISPISPISPINPTNPNPTNLKNNPTTIPAEFTQSRVSINSIDQIQYFPEIQPVQVVADPEFDRICQLLRVAM